METVIWIIVILAVVVIIILTVITSVGKLSNKMVDKYFPEDEDKKVNNEEERN